MNEMHYFDPRVEYSVIERKLPHWAQAGVVSFITWRTRDSMPIEVLQRWRGERLFWLRKNGIDPFGVAWREQLRQLPLAEQHEFFTIFSKKWHSELDAGHGACVLKSPLLARIVSDSLLKFDGDRYIVSDFVVMPNHVHLLAAFRDEGAMLEQCEGWKHFQAFKIN